MAEDASAESAEARERRRRAVRASTEPGPERPSAPPAERSRTAPPATAFDFYPLQDAKFTELHAFFEHLRAGRFTTTRCPRDDKLLWPPRLVCPTCHQGELEWVDLPTRGTVYAFSAVLAGAPMGMEAEVPFSVGLVDLEGVPLRLFGRIEGTRWDALRIGQEVTVAPVALDDGRVFYRFRVEGAPSAPTSDQL
ncbi:MAG TPA: OB-fold domain-containing protein [Thermoplasmata archaeon]|nr:OB-fold domain-containing protein [Thermoplasmata archaeon]